MCRVRQRDFTHYVYLCVCLHVRDWYAICMRQRGHFHSFTLKAAGTSTHCMHAAARALSLFHSQGSAALSVFHALYACGSAGTCTLSLSRQRGGTWACLYVGGDGLPDCSALSLLVCWGSRSSWWSVSCSPVALRVWFVLSCCQRSVMLSAMHAHDLARLRTTYVCRCASRCVSRCHARGGAGGLAMEAWRWRLGAGGLALEASWPVAVRRRPLVVALGAAWRGVARRGMWRGECRLWVPRA